ncbi:predicted protein [Nematostella vectensis]|uniref:Uncharacterized protein n=1 Tax=Nematostella vectensis TaxID=45351 RepID=A7RG28_NEMVE|nr:predicted protein [Nematostella vectensis]|eukprot:XP_001641410.1 predicted protein [Nematostella vectensis]
MIILYSRCDSEIRDHARHHVTISGGTTTAQGFVPRLQSELKQIEPKIKKLRAPEHRKYSAWIGGSILGSLPTMDSQYVTVDEYADSGPRIVHRKCF